jgi:hypothetical protein
MNIFLGYYGFPMIRNFAHSGLIFFAANKTTNYPFRLHSIEQPHLYEPWSGYWLFPSFLFDANILNPLSVLLGCVEQTKELGANVYS